jgi:hypothetical protein
MTFLGVTSAGLAILWSVIDVRSKIDYPNEVAKKCITPKSFHLDTQTVEFLAKANKMLPQR